MAQRKIDVVLDSVRRLQRLGATANLVNLLHKQHPADLAQVFAELGEKDRVNAFSLLVERNSKLAMEALSELGPEAGAALLADRSAEDIARLLHDLPSDDAAAIIDNLPEELSAAVLELIEKRPGDEVGELLEYDEQTAGRIMNPKVFALSEDMTAGEAITTLQGSRDVEMVFYLYVVDGRRHLVGVISLRRLLLVPTSTPLKRIMTTELTSVRTDTDQEEVARLVASYNLLAIPVVDEENKLVGVITVDDVIDVIKDEATEDVYRLAGVAGDDRVVSSARDSLRKRVPWLQVNLATAFLAASVVALFEGRIKDLPALAVFMPVVAGMGGNAATQTLTVIVRGIALGELTAANVRKALFKEASRRPRQRRRLRSRRLAGRLDLERGLLARRHPLRRDDHQHVRGGNGRDADPTGAARDEGRPGAGLVGLHHHADRRIRFRVVARPRHALHQVPAHAG